MLVQCARTGAEDGRARITKHEDWQQKRALWTWVRPEEEDRSSRRAEERHWSRTSWRAISLAARAVSAVQPLWRCIWPTAAGGGARALSLAGVRGSDWRQALYFGRLARPPASPAADLADSSFHAPLALRFTRPSAGRDTNRPPLPALPFTMLSSSARQPRPSLGACNPSRIAQPAGG